MSDNFDPCECIYTHETSMQRLLSMLRQSQVYCNDVVCQTEPVNPLMDQGDSQISTSIFMLFAWIFALAGVLIFQFYRQGNSIGLDKPRPAENDDQEPPTIF